MADNSKIKLGIWLQVHAENGLVGEGISRVLAFVVRAAMNRNDVEITIACLPWMQEPVKKFFKQLDIDIQHINFISGSNSIPYLQKIRRYYENRRRSKKKDKKDSMLKIIKDTLKRILDTVLSEIITVNNPLELLIYLAIGIVVLPVAVVVYLCYRILSLIGKVLRIRKATDKVTNKLKEFNHRENIGVFIQLYYKMVGLEYKKLAKRLDQANKLDCIYFPYPINEHVKSIDKPIVLCVADVVYLDFPNKYINYFDYEKVEDILKTNLEKARSVITFSEYVRKSHVGQYFSDLNNVHVIRHANISTYEHLEHLKMRTHLELKELATKLIINYVRKITKKDKNDSKNIYLNNFPFEDVEYIFASSQCREHKNFINLFKAHEILLRERYRNIKLIITGNPEVVPELDAYIKERRMQYDILNISQLPPRIHAAFYARAALTVVPTLFEGGFPGPFSESVSVNTPVIMSKIPVTLELLSENEHDYMLFDPYNVDEIVDKIEWALDHREELLEKQKLIYEIFDERTWNDVGNEYIEVMKASI